MLPRRIGFTAPASFHMHVYMKFMAHAPQNSEKLPPKVQVLSLLMPQQSSHAACSEVRIGGMLTGKCGLLYCHMGGGKEGLQPLRDALALTEIPVTQILPTHMARSSALVQDGAQWLQDGGWLDFTAGDQVQCYAKLCLPCIECRWASVTSQAACFLQPGG